MPIETSAAVRPGVYRHFKGGSYLVLGVAVRRASDGVGEQRVVVYTRLAGEPELEYRPLGEFLELVVREQPDGSGDTVSLPRFWPVNAGSSYSDAAEVMKVLADAVYDEIGR